MGLPLFLQPLATRVPSWVIFLLRGPFTPKSVTSPLFLPIRGAFLHSNTQGFVCLFVFSRTHHMPGTLLCTGISIVKKKKNKLSRSYILEERGRKMNKSTNTHKVIIEQCHRWDRDEEVASLGCELSAWAISIRSLGEHLKR